LKTGLVILQAPPVAQCFRVRKGSLQT